MKKTPQTLALLVLMTVLTACASSLSSTGTKATHQQEAQTAQQSNQQSSSTQPILNKTAQAPESKVISVDELQFNQPVIDKVNLLNNLEKQQLTDKILSIHQDKKLAQTGLLIVPSTAEQTIFDYGLSVANKWKLGSKEKNDGLLIVMAMDSRAIRIFTGYGLEKALPDEMLATIIKSKMVPSFKQQKFAEGLLLGLDEIEAQLENNRALIGQMP